MFFIIRSKGKKHSGILEKSRSPHKNLLIPKKREDMVLGESVIHNLVIGAHLGGFISSSSPYTLLVTSVACTETWIKTKNFVYLIPISVFLPVLLVFLVQYTYCQFTFHVWYFTSFVWAFFRLDTNLPTKLWMPIVFFW